MVYNVFCKKSKADSVNIEIKQNEQLADKLQKAIIKKEEFILHLKAIFGMLIYLICNAKESLIKELNFYYVSLIFLVNMHRLFL